MFIRKFEFVVKSKFFCLQLHYYLIFNQASEAFIEDTMGRLSLVSDGGEALASADLVVEAITENLPLKQVNRRVLILNIKKIKFLKDSINILSDYELVCFI